jgi:hypothetical protein
MLISLVTSVSLLVAKVEAGAEVEEAHYFLTQLLDAGMPTLPL